MPFSLPSFQPLTAEYGQIGASVSAATATLVYGDAYNLAFFYANDSPVTNGQPPGNAYAFNHTGISVARNGSFRRPTGKYLRHANTIPRPFFYDPSASGAVTIDSDNWENVPGVKNYFCYNSADYMNHIISPAAEFYADIYHPRLAMTFYAEVSSTAKARIVVYDNISLDSIAFGADPSYTSEEITVTSAAINTVTLDMDRTPEYRARRLQYAADSTVLFAVLQVQSTEGIDIEDNPTALLQTWPGFAMTTLEL
jgi:hypothetical protein